jgi:hypothetical protein
MPVLCGTRAESTTKRFIRPVRAVLPARRMVTPSPSVFNLVLNRHRPAANSHAATVVDHGLSGWAVFELLPLAIHEGIGPLGRLYALTPAPRMTTVPLRRVRLGGLVAS